MKAVDVASASLSPWGRCEDPAAGLMRGCLPQPEACDPFQLTVGRWVGHSSCGIASQMQLTSSEHDPW